MQYLLFLLMTTIPVAEDSISAGQWVAELETPGGPIKFPLELKQTRSLWSATIQNPLEPINVPKVHVAGGQLTLHFPHYDSRIQAEMNDGILVGKWEKRRGNNQTATMNFRATPGRFDAIRAEQFKGFAGRWSVQFSESSDPAIGQFHYDAQHGPWGTFLTTTGDYRYLVVQDVHKENCRLSCFDGSHAFLFSMKIQSDQTLKGDFWSGTSWHETWTAVRNESAVLPDAFQQTVMLQDIDLSAIKFPGLDGKMRALADPEFVGECRIIQVFGSWCPNCHDAALYLKELNDRYSKQGLKIVGLAFEHTGEFNRDVRQVKRYIERHQTPYPILLAGTSDKSDATEQLKLLDRVRSYPTTIFMNQAGEVKAVYTGFSGPATGDAYAKLRQTFEQTIERILNE